MSIFYENENEVKITLKHIPDELLSSFNKEQREAIKASLPLTIIAGPGSGKTSTIIAKLILQIIDNIDTLKESLILTFTNKAAGVILERLSKSLDTPLNPVDYYTGTFHGILYKILRENVKELLNYGFKRVPTIMDSQEDMSFFLKIVELFYNEDNDKKKTELVEEFINIHGFAPKDFLLFINEELNKAPTNFKDMTDKIVSTKSQADELNKTKLRMIIKRYFEQKIKENLLSFTDILLYSYFIIRDNEEFREKIKTKFKYIFVDEYQDTNPIESKIIDLIETNNYCKIGDPYQSIYKFLGAELNNIMEEFEKPNITIKQLLLNYRSTDNIVQLTNDVVSIFKETVPNYKHCKSANEELKNLPIIAMDYCEEEKEIIKEIRNRIRAGVELKEIAVLIRSKMVSYALEKELVKNRLPYKKVGGQEFYQIKEITYMIDLLKIVSGEFSISNFESFASLFDKMGASTLEKVAKSYINRENEFQSLKELIEKEYPKNKALQNIKEQLLNIEKLDINTLKRILNLPELNFKKKIEKKLSNPSLERIKEIEKNIEYMLADIEKILKKDSVSELREYLMTLTLDNTKDKKEEEKANKITISTLHSAKGLEWNSCFIMGCDVGVFPSQKSLSFQSQLEEEKRLFYVGVSRAKEFLFISARGKLNQFISPFLYKNYIDYRKQEEGMGFKKLW